MADRCEPPEELRAVDGWHWLYHPRWEEWPARYSAPCHAGIWPIWQCPDSNWTTPAAHREGWRYVAPLTSPAAVAALEADRDDWKRLCFVAEPEVAAMQLEIQRLRAIVRVNGLRHGATHAEIDAVLAGAAP